MSPKPEKESSQFAVRPCPRKYLKMGEESHPSNKAAEPQDHYNTKCEK